MGGRPAQAISPLHAKVAAKFKNVKKTKVAYRRAGPNEPVMQWQAKRGFAHVPEATMKKLVATLGVEIDATDFANSADDFEFGLKAAAMITLDPNLTADDLSERLNSALELQAKEDPQKTGELFNKDSLHTCMLKDDFLTAKEFIDNAETKATERGKTHKKIEKVTDKLFGGKYFRKLTGKNPPAVPRKKPLNPYRPAWKVMLREANVALFDTALPKGFRIHVDDFNGCYRVYYGPDRVRSISWTTRGESVAIREVLIESWLLAKLWTGKACPFQPFLDLGA